MSSAISRYAVIGKPIAHSRSPIMQQAAFAAAGLSATYQAIEAGREESASLMERLRAEDFAGWNITTPLKEAAIESVDSLTDDAAAVQAINTVRKESDGTLTGHNTDGRGLVRALADRWSWSPCAKRVLLLGSGPAARAVARALRAAGVAELFCWSRNSVTAKTIGAPLRREVDLVVSALPSEAEPPEDILSAANEETIVFDLNYGGAPSPVSAMAGGRRSDGLLLLLHQGALSFEWWTGLPAPLEAMRSALELA